MSPAEVRTCNREARELLARQCGAARPKPDTFTAAVRNSARHTAKLHRCSSEQHGPMPRPASSKVGNCSFRGLEPGRCSSRTARPKVGNSSRAVAQLLRSSPELHAPRWRHWTQKGLREFAYLPAPVLSICITPRGSASPKPTTMRWPGIRGPAHRPRTRLPPPPHRRPAQQASHHVHHHVGYARMPPRHQQLHQLGGDAHCRERQRHSPYLPARHAESDCPPQ